MTGKLTRWWMAGWLLVTAVLPGRAGWIFDGVPSTWEGTQDELKADEETFPVLRLELGGTWTDFEIKASTNNFETLVYYYISSGLNDSGCDDADPFTYYCDDHAVDVRRWIAVTAHSAIGGQILSPSTEIECVYFCPSHACEADWRNWMSQQDTNLVWSWVRCDGVAFEMNATGTRQHWNPVRPERWERARTVP
ncbi:MAG: hypothetical protein PHR35_11115 [Kiritimatiellae bacterium]|nr:hypothetical protein [Kiritimatiellia bacterium]